MPPATRPDRTPPSTDTAAALAVACLGVGVLALIGLLGVPGLGFAGTGWRLLFGWLAWPLALLLVAAGIGLVRGVRRGSVRVPWPQVVGAELALVAAMALLALAFGPEAGGIVGGSLATGVGDRIGAPLAALAWFAVGAVGILLGFSLGRERLRAWLPDPEASRDALPPGPADEGRPAAGPPPSQAALPPAAMPEPAEAAEAEPAPAPQRRARAAEPPKAEKPASPRRGRHTRTVGLPPLDIWTDDVEGTVSDADVAAMGEALTKALDAFGVPVDIVDVERGPNVTRFGVRPGVVERGGQRRRIRVARITALRDDLALALAAPTIRIEAPVPGRPMVGIEVPNPRKDVVSLRRLLDDRAFRRVSRTHRLALPLGRAVSGEAVIGDLAGMPHLLIAGATGTGKSVCIGSILCGLTAQNTPDHLQLVLIDPKRVELQRFGRLPHLRARVVHDAEEAVAALRWALEEIDARYRRFAERRARDLAAYNRSAPAGEAPLPVLCVVIDELADLMMTAPHEFEPLLARIAQLGRAAGVHLVLATQRPSVDVLTGLIKANVPARIAFAVASQTDSRVILDQPGAETLLGRGDLLFLSGDAPRPRRAQGAFVSDAEVERLTEFWAASHWTPPKPPAPWLGLIAPLDADEALYEKAADLAGEHPDLTASFLQRRLRVGYRKARELYERLDAEGMLQAKDDGAGDAWYDE